jgi:hypothetical protein
MHIHMTQYITNVLHNSRISTTDSLRSLLLAVCLLVGGERGEEREQQYAQLCMMSSSLCSILYCILMLFFTFSKCARVSQMQTVVCIVCQQPSKVGITEAYVHLPCPLPGKADINFNHSPNRNTDTLSGACHNPTTQLPRRNFHTRTGV